jgi:hypothetical protein
MILTGCMTMRRKQALTVATEPGVAQVTVAAEAVAKCYNLILVEYCALDLQMRQVGGPSSQSPQAKKVRAFITANYDKIVGELDSGRGPSLSALLDLLRTPAKERAEAILKMKECDVRAGQDHEEFAALVAESLLRFQ